MKELTIELVKKHLNLDEDFTDDDMYLYQLILAVQNSILKKCNLPSWLGNTNKCIYRRNNECTLNQVCKCEEWTSSKRLEPALVQAMLLFIGNLYLNREPVITVNINKIPYTFEYLLESYVNYSDKKECSSNCYESGII